MDTQVISYQQFHAQRQADSDMHLIALWLHGKAASTQAPYPWPIVRCRANGEAACNGRARRRIQSVHHNL